MAWDARQLEEENSTDGFDCLGGWVNDWIDIEWLRKHAVEPIVPAQLFPTRQLEPWERLWLRILSDALHVYAASWSLTYHVRVSVLTPSRKRSQRNEVMRWFRGAPARITFAEIVDHFGIKRPDVFRVLNGIAVAGKAGGSD